MLYTVITTVTGKPPSYVYDLSLDKAYTVAMRPEMRQAPKIDQPPNRWHVMLYDYAKSKILALEPEESVAVAYETPGPNPDDSVTRIEIKRQITDPATEAIINQARTTPQVILKHAAP